MLDIIHVIVLKILQILLSQILQMIWPLILDVVVCRHPILSYKIVSFILLVPTVLLTTTLIYHI